MSYASKEWTENYLGQTLKTAKEQGLLGSGGGGDTLIGFEDYSEEEKIIGKWTDGKPVYRKIVRFTTNEYDFSLAHNIDIDEPIKISGVYTVTSKGSGAIVRMTDCDYVGYPTYSIDGWLTKTAIRIAIGEAWQNNVDAVAILEYTKTTDEPGSFNNNMIASQFECTGIGYDNYSEDEVCIGKWIDGRPLYRKTLDLPSTSGKGLQTVNLGLSNIDRINVNLSRSWVNITSTAEIIPLMNNWDTGAVGGYLFDISDQSNVKIKIYRNIWYGTGIFTIEYTKTTDEPNSFTPDMVYNGMIDASEATDEEVEEVFSNDSN